MKDKYYTYLEWDYEIGGYRQGPYFTDKAKAEVVRSSYLPNWGRNSEVYEVVFVRTIEADGE